MKVEEECRMAAARVVENAAHERRRMRRKSSPQSGLGWAVALRIEGSAMELKKAAKMISLE